MNQHELLTRYMEAIDYHLWLSDLSKRKRDKIRDDVEEHFHFFYQSNPSLEECKAEMERFGTPKELVDKRVNSKKEWLSNGSIKRGVAFIPIFSIFDSFTFSDFLQGLQQNQLGQLFPYWILITFFFLVSIGIFYFYRYDEKFFREVFLCVIVGFIPLYLLFLGIDHYLEEPSLSLFLVPMGLIVLTITVAKYIRKKYGLDLS